MHRSPLGILLGEHAPLATRFQNVEHAVEHIEKIDRSWPRLLASGFKHRTDALKLLARNVALVALYLGGHSGERGRDTLSCY